MITVYVWRYRGLTSAMGHASMQVDNHYISWWPEGNDRIPKVPGAVGQKLRLYSVPHVQGQTFLDDQYLEAMDANTVQDPVTGRYYDVETKEPLKPKPPDETIALNGLDEARLLAWWKKFNVPDRDWSTLAQNCATTVGRGLTVAGGDDYCHGFRSWWDSWNVIWHPRDVSLYARAIKAGLTNKTDTSAAINLIRRYCKSPLGLTSFTLSMDEQGLAEALVRRSAKEISLVLNVFEELDNRRNVDADDVAEKYVQSIRQTGGPALAALARSDRLKFQLIKSLSQGWTTGREADCIAFLRALA